MGTPRKHVVRPAPDQRERLTDLTRTGAAAARKGAHPRVLGPAAAAHPDGQRPDTYIATALGLHGNAVAKPRERFALGGQAPALDRKPRAAPPVPPKVDGRVDAHPAAIGCSPAPEGRARSTSESLAGELRGRGSVTSAGTETPREAVKETTCNRGGSSAGASPGGSRRGPYPRGRTCWNGTPPGIRATVRRCAWAGRASSRVVWRVTTDDARMRLRHLYPQVKT
jgi:hypothetical protein